MLQVLLETNNFLFVEKCLLRNNTGFVIRTHQIKKVYEYFPLEQKVILFVGISSPSSPSIMYLLFNSILMPNVLSFAGNQSQSAQSAI